MGIILLILVITSVISIAWASGISKMNEEHPDYNGEDFLN